MSAARSCSRVRKIEQPRLAIGARADKLRLAGGAIDVQGFHRRTGALERIGRGRALSGRAGRLDAEIVILDLERGDLLRHAGAGHDGVLHGMPQRGRRVDGREHFAARAFDVRLEPFNLALRGDIRGFLGRERGRRRVALGSGSTGRLAARFELEPGRLLTGVERAHFGLDLGRGMRQLFDLLAVERDLLLQPADFQLAGVSGFAGRGRLPIGLHQLQPQPLERRFELGQSGRSSGLTLAGARELGPSGFDRFAKHAVALGELDLLPAPQFFPQPLVATRLGRLPL